MAAHIMSEGDVDMSLGADRTSTGDTANKIGRLIWRTLAIFDSFYPWLLFDDRY